MACLFCIVLNTVVWAATEADVIAALKQTYTIADKPYRLPNSYIVKAEEYMEKHELSSEQCDRLLAAIYKGVGIAQKSGTTDIHQMDREQIQEALNVVVEVTQAAEIDLTEELSKKPSTSNSSKIEKPKEDVISVSGDSGEIVATTDDNEFISNALSELVTTNDTINLNETMEKNITYVFLGLILLFFINFFIIYLIFKSKWNRIIKYIMITVFVILVLIILAIIVVGLCNLEYIRAVYKLYNMFK